MTTPAEQLRDLLYPGVTHMLRDHPEVEYNLRATHGRIVLDLPSPTRPDGVARDIISAKEVDDGSFRVLFKPRVEAAIQSLFHTERHEVKA